MNRILIIEDDDDLREGLTFSLGAEGCEVISAPNAAEGMAAFTEKRPDLVILDCNLPDGNGFEICGEMKKQSSAAIIMLTARDTELDEVKALELGMDDFMSKPFSLAVLKARIKRLLRKSDENDKMISGNITLDRTACKVCKNGEQVELSKVEYQLLSYLMYNEGAVLSKEQILQHVWDSHGNFVDENTLQVNVRRLRAKLEDDPKSPTRLVTVYGIGYIWKKV
ncbi:response regulator transcription factor [Ruminococcus sp.]|uniref:response regulator transcription factor n=1 Tax=Ruminococcus sp. TaxID=41978 RepID=UPI0025FBF7F7|nr:response regulator transcription factor [Ruminococcus sp.]MBQ8967820.1 response regulator transcription factor [Ruminococcus sp.]